MTPLGGSKRSLGQRLSYQLDMHSRGHGAVLGWESETRVRVTCNSSELLTSINTVSPGLHGIEHRAAPHG